MVEAVLRATQVHRQCAKVVMLTSFVLRRICGEGEGSRHPSPGTRENRQRALAAGAWDILVDVNRYFERLPLESSGDDKAGWEAASDRNVQRCAPCRGRRGPLTPRRPWVWIRPRPGPLALQHCSKWPWRRLDANSLLG